jgi:hypothetical protein
MKAFILDVKLQLGSRQGDFLLHWRIDGDDWLQSIALLALLSSMPANHRAVFDRYSNFKDAWSMFYKMYALRKECFAN